MATFYINPYDISKSGMYFDTDAIGTADYDDLDDLLEKKIKGKFEEYSLEFIDGDQKELAMWEAASRKRGAHYSALKVWLEIFETVDDHEMPGVYWAMDDMGESDLSAAKSYAEDAMVREGTVKELAGELIDESPEVYAENYFDYRSLATDIEINNELPEEAYDEDGEQLWDDREVLDYVERLVDEIGVENVNNYQYYVDEDKLARDLGYDYSEFLFDGVEHIALAH